ncbi:unnamed protein product [Rotaria sp. Silwood2]|nr:unnamed protein product [Rotaria sp. Silwood2]CAF4033666.1 unnamed protein product [Rotaria sp. Silwood2]CAF4093839.1 unnamed protein product [Rotaria sp. Silwood2]CAF4191705.1 unnamed protein product [Rotaria sp. Silwood2]CAF4559406.1 unnamed protein product [Rotaria sp. Silwood2]
MSNAYPFYSSSISITDNNNNEDNNDFEHRNWFVLNKKTLNDDNDNIYLERKERGTGFYIVRNGDYILFIPDSKHHFTKNMRPYIGRRR